MSLIRRLELAEHKDRVERIEDGKAVLKDGCSVFDEITTLKVTLSEYDEKGNRTNHVVASSGPLANGSADIFFDSPALIVQELEERIENEKLRLEGFKRLAIDRYIADELPEWPTPIPTVVEDEPVKIPVEFGDIPDPDGDALKRLQSEENPEVGKKLLEALEEESKAPTQPLEEPAQS
jgi:hypothetical protein